MKKFTKLTCLNIAIIMILQIFLPTLSYALEDVELKVQKERPYSDDDRNGKVGDDIYTIIRKAIQTVLKIGEKSKESDELDFSLPYSYYCLRSDIALGTDDEQLNYVKYEAKDVIDLKDKEAIQTYYREEIGHELSDDNYNAICWIANKMYIPNLEYSDKLEEELLKEAGITESQLTVDDIEVIQQVALWYFTN